MPIYEYRCESCHRPFSLFVRGFSFPVEPRCAACGSQEVTRQISRFAVVRSEESRLDAMEDASWVRDVDEDDPRSVGRWARRMGQEMGEDMGQDFGEMMEQMEAGEMPPELAGEDEGEASWDEE